MKLLLDGCPRCGGRLIVDWDGYNKYYTCIYCAREYDLELKPIRISLQKGLTNTRGRAKIKVGG